MLHRTIRTQRQVNDEPLEMVVAEVLNYGAATTAFIAAFFWFLSAFVKGVSKEKPDESGFISASIIVNGGDLSKTMRKQSKYSAVAAVFAGLAAVLQAMAMLVG